MSDPSPNYARRDESERAYYQRLRRTLAEADLDDAQRDKLAMLLEEYRLGRLPVDSLSAALTAEPAIP